jgi:cytochrome c oxidase cbb3-type subunit 1
MPVLGHRRFHRRSSIIALQLAYPVLNFDLPWTNFGRLRPLHTSAVIFAFGGNVLLARRSMSCSAPAGASCLARSLPWFVVWATTPSS